MTRHGDLTAWTGRSSSPPRIRSRRKTRVTAAHREAVEARIRRGMGRGTQRPARMEESSLPSFVTVAAR
jgi:hypothetical protein